MLDYTILNLKRKLKPDSNYNEQRYDLLSQPISTVDFSPEDIIVVNKYYVARPDLIALAVYGDDKYADFICKYNGISNPFELNEDDVIYIPGFDKFNSMIKNSIDSSEIIENTNSKIIPFKEHEFQKEIDEVRSPAQQTVGETNYVIDKSLGVVFY